MVTQKSYRSRYTPASAVPAAAIPAVVAVAAAAAAPTPAPTARPKAKIQLGFKSKTKESTKTVYPTVPDPEGHLYALAKQVKVTSRELEALQGAVETSKAELKSLIRPRFFEMHTGKQDVPSSVAIPTTEGDVLVTFSGRYKEADADHLMQRFGEDFVDKQLKQSFSITIDGSQLPTVLPGNPCGPGGAPRCPAQEFIDELTALVAKYGVEDAITQKDELKPTPEFHKNRHVLLTPEENIAFDDACPMVIMIKTKGRDE